MATGKTFTANNPAFAGAAAGATSGGGGESYIDIDFAQRSKHGQHACGDVFLTRKIKEEGRVISVLSDGLGSGVKAGVLANLTATMTLKYTAAFVDVRKSARTVMATLPICELRKISYSTFTVIDLDDDGSVRIVEHGNPPLLLMRGNREVPLEKTTFTVEEWKDRLITYSECKLRIGDRLVSFSDGVSQSGMGQPGFPLGWGRDNVSHFVADQIAREPKISSKRLAEVLVNSAYANDRRRAGDDITAAVAYFRSPRHLLLVTGPPFSRERDHGVAELVRSAAGRVAICGGTTAGIVARCLNREIDMSLDNLDPEIPPPSRMEGVDLVTEGTLTLAKTADVLERGTPLDQLRPNPVRDLASLLLESDIVQFVVGTRINEAHQDPAVPVELDLRRNIVRKIAHLLENRYLKETRIQFV